MANKKMEIELTDEQAKKVEILQSKGISVGEAIDMLFEVKEKAITYSKEVLDERISDAVKQKEELENQISEINKYISIFTQLNDDSIDIEQKQKLLEKEYVVGDETYEMQVQRTKHGISWAKDFFRF